MRILFVCGSLDEGRNGVGDYARRLCGELIRMGHDCRAIATHDREVSVATRESQSGDGAAVHVLRIPRDFGREARAAEALGYASGFRADWLSVQFVTFAYDVRGLCWRFASLIQHIRGSSRVHIMFHELWHGSTASLPPVKRLLNMAHRHIVRRLPEKLDPSLMTTQLERSRRQLGYPEVAILPLFGNIPLEASSAPSASTASSATATGEAVPLRVIVFGSAPSPREFERQLAWLERYRGGDGHAYELWFAGRNGAHAEVIYALARAAVGRDRVRLMGPLDAAGVSRAFAAADLGLAKNGVSVLGKSGSAVSMLEHGLPVLVNPDDGGNNAGVCPVSGGHVLLTSGAPPAVVPESAPISMLPAVARRLTRLMIARASPLPAEDVGGGKRLQRV